MSDKHKILLVCSSGMSTSLLVKAMQKAADSEGYPAEVAFAPVAGFEDRLEGVKAVLAGPQIKHRFEEMKGICGESKIPVEIIPNQIYGLVDGKKALDLAKKMIAG